VISHLDSTSLERPSVNTYLSSFLTCHFFSQKTGLQGFIKKFIESKCQVKKGPFCFKKTKMS
jgi:hypothetical protein